jgi:hypothetical protein
MVFELRRFALAIVVVVSLPLAAAAQSPLPLGAPQQGKVSSDNPVEYTVVAKTAGLLGIAVQGEGDLAFQVTDEDGQTLPDGNVDRDLNGSEGTEMVSMLIPEPGTYKVRVRVQGNATSTFTIGGSWLSFPPFARASSDPDRRPRSARSLVIGKAHEDSLNSEAGDLWDWFVMKASQSGTLAIVTRRVGDGDSDLVLEVYLNNDFSKPADRSDQDLQGNNANESVTVNVDAGQVVHVKVAGTFSRTNTKYRVSSSLIP